MQAGEIIREHRLRNGMTQEALAIQTGINVRTIQRIENSEVMPRSHSLKTIATALHIDITLFFNDHKPVAAHAPEKGNKGMLVGLHLSGLLLLPALMIWLFEKDNNKQVKEHGVDVINFQLSMLVILIPCLPLLFVALLIAIFTVVVILINTVKVMGSRPHHYPFCISFLKR